MQADPEGSIRARRRVGRPRRAPAAGEAPDIAAFIGRILRSEKFGDDVVHAEQVPGRAAAHAGPRLPLAAPIQGALADLGIARLYTHQAEALDRLREGHDVLTITPTASGKSLVYLMATAESALAAPGSRALWLFPYKALAQDQLLGMGEFAAAVARHGGTLPGEGGLPGARGRPLTAAIYDGDTPDARRRRIKADPPDVLITNPDMLHLGILTHHEDWREFLARLRLVVVDELHVYRGIFGTHMHHVLKRLERLAALHGSRPRFIASSATIGNPETFGATLTGREFAVVRASGAPRAPHHLLFLNPGGSPYTAAVAILSWALDAGLRAIAFTKARATTELVHSWLLRAAPRHAGRISAYRSGYLPDERRAIEKRLFEGSLQAVIATSALELGIDVGGLDVCVLVGYPGSIVSSWQRIGRVGRADRPALTVLVAMPDALDQYFMAHPRAFFERGFEDVVLDPANPVIARDHLICAGAEAPIEDPADRRRYGAATFALVDGLERDGALARDATARRWFTLRRRPQRDVGLRSTGATYTIIDDGPGRVIGTIDGVRAFHETHRGAVYLHHGQQYLVRDLDVEARRVRVVRAEVDYYTEVRGGKETEILSVERRAAAGPLRAGLGRLRVTETLTGYEERRLHGRERLGHFDLTLPPLRFETVGLWIVVPDALRDALVAAERHFMGGIHAVEHAMISLFPLLAICDRGDIGGISYPLHPQLGRAAIFVYDGHPGGIGLAARGFDRLTDLLEKTAALLVSCACESGCPSCIQSPKCGNGNNPLDKEAARAIAGTLCGRLPLPGSPEEDTVMQPIVVRGSAAGDPPDPAVPAPLPRRVLGAGLEWEPAPTPARRGSDGPAAAREQTLFFDLETQRSAEEVGGWRNLDKMKLALAVTYNDVSSEFKTHLEKDVESLLLDLAMADRVVGYNIDRFDLPVLRAYTRWDLKRIRTFDMLADIYRKLGFRLKLTDLAQATLGVGKSGDGLQSLQWWKEGKIDLIERYCRRDVEVTRDLYNFGRTNGYVMYRDKDGRTLRLPVNWA